jgi:uncharacterized YigZ family protein
MYKILVNNHQYAYEEKRSQFIAHLFPVTTREQALGHLNTLKVQYPNARHHCWAYLIGNPEQPSMAAYNDDGEPSGTAGRPILHVLTQRGAGNSCAIVVRYFGGIKLGAGGLVRAYGQAVSLAIDGAKWNTVVSTQTYWVQCQYEDEPQVRHCAEHWEGEVLAQNYDAQVKLEIRIPCKNHIQFKESLLHKTAGRCHILINE